MNTQKPDNNLVWAILATVLCCMPFGIVAIIKASKVDTLWAQGDQEGAISAAAEAKKWSIIAAICAVVWAVLYFISCFVVGFTSTFSEFM